MKRETDLEGARVRDREKYYADPSGSQARSRRWKEANAEAVSAYKKTYREAHAAETKAGFAAWAAANPAKRSATEAHRKAMKLRATPAWANEFFIEEAYDLAQLRTRITGYEWHVDHIVPLRSKVVCGLHVEHNLRVIPAVRNLEKGNRHWPDMP